MSFTRRHLPHWIPEHSSIFVTWRLAGSLPGQRTGPMWLQDERVAKIIADALLYGETTRHLYDLRAWVIMPNHVHAIWIPHAEMTDIMNWLKSRTARLANRILGRSGPFWQEESYDHWIRTSEELSYLVDYVHSNPVRAKLVTNCNQYPWSTATSRSFQNLPPAPMHLPSLGFPAH